MIPPYCNAKYLVLVVLVVQNTCLVLLMRYSRTRPGTMYLGSTAVCCDEAMKLATCMCILGFAYYCGGEQRRRGGGGGGMVVDGGGGYDRLGTVAEEEDDDDDDGEEDDDATNNGGGGGGETRGGGGGRRYHGSFREYLSDQLQFDVRMAGLAGLYTLQKNLLYLAISNLDAAVFQVTYQTKILTTAIFSVLLLRRKLSRHKVVALFVLTLGVSLVQLDKVEENSSKSYQEQSRWVGVLAVLGACCTSGFGGVYFELVLKPRPSSEPPPGGGLGGRIHPPPPREPPSVWAKNVQLSAFALLIALVASFVKDHDAILAGGFFQGYSPLVVLVVMLEAGGGLVVAVVIKYADNILKSFATAVSIVTSTIVSALVFGFTISKLFVCGCLFVFAAIVLYSRDDDVGVDVGKAGGGGVVQRCHHRLGGIGICR